MSSRKQVFTRDNATASRPSRQELRQKLAALLHEIAGFREDLISDESALDGDLAMQSVAFVELQVAIEEEYGIELDAVRVVELNTFGAIVDYVHSLKNSSCE